MSAYSAMSGRAQVRRISVVQALAMLRELAEAESAPSRLVIAPASCAGSRRGYRNNRRSRREREDRA